MADSKYEFNFHYNAPDEDTINSINAILAVQKYSKVTVSNVKPAIVTITECKLDGTVIDKRIACGLYDISFVCEAEDYRSCFDYRLYMELIPAIYDPGTEKYKKRWEKLHLYSTMCQTMTHKYEEYTIYVVLYHDGKRTIPEH